MKKIKIVIILLLIGGIYFTLNFIKFNNEFSSLKFKMNHFATEINLYLENKETLKEEVKLEIYELEQKIDDLYLIAPRTKLIDLEILDYKYSQLKYIVDDYQKIVQYNQNQMYEIDLILNGLMTSE